MEIHVTQQTHEASDSQRHLVDMLVGSRYTKLQVSIVFRFVRGETQKKHPHRYTSKYRNISYLLRAVSGFENQKRLDWSF